MWFSLLYTQLHKKKNKETLLWAQEVIARVSMPKGKAFPEN